MKKYFAFILVLIFVLACKQEAKQNLSIQIYQVEKTESIYQNFLCCGLKIDSAILTLAKIDSSSLSFMEKNRKKKELMKAIGSNGTDYALASKLRFCNYEFEGVLNFYSSGVIGISNCADTQYVYNWLNGTECEKCYTKKLNFKWFPYPGDKNSAGLLALKNEKPMLSIDTNAIDSIVLYRRPSPNVSYGRQEFDREGKVINWYGMFVSLKTNHSKNIQKLMRKDLNAAYFFYSTDTILRVFSDSEKEMMWKKIHLESKVLLKEKEIPSIRGMYGEKVFVKEY